jgi:hypothetical protein
MHEWEIEGLDLCINGASGTGIVELETWNLACMYIKWELPGVDEIVVIDRGGAFWEVELDMIGALWMFK